MIKAIFSFLILRRKGFHKFKYLIDINEVNIGKIVYLDKVSFSKTAFKYLIGHKNDDKIKSLCIMLPKVSSYVKSFDKSKYVFFY